MVVDADNDGSAEILVTSGDRTQAVMTPLQLLRHVDDRWVAARRIWNQHTYHITNVLEDGRIPQFEQPSWQLFNTFRAQAQVEGSHVCIPARQTRMPHAELKPQPRLADHAAFTRDLRHVVVDTRHSCHAWAAP